MAHSNSGQKPIEYPKSPSPTDTIEDVVVKAPAFARLIPHNVEACRAFNGVAEAILSRDIRYAHHEQFMHMDERKAPIRLAARMVMMASHIGEPEDTETETETDTEQDSDAQTNRDALADQEMVWTGYYQLSLAIPPGKPAFGWRIGSGRWKIGKKKEEPNGAVDLLLTLNTRQSGVCGSHACLAFDRRSGILLLHARHALPHGIKLNNESFGLQSRALNARSVTIHIGNLEYRHEYSLDPNTVEEAAFQREKQDFFRDYLNAPPPIEFTSATPSETDMVLGNWTLHRAIGRGTYGTVSAASHRTGRYAAFKYMVRHDRASDKSIAAEVDVAQELSSVLSELDFRQRVLRLVEVIYQRGSASFDGAGPEVVCIIYTPLARGTFGDLLAGQKFSHLDQEFRATLFMHVLQGLAFLHAQKWVHRDIKPINLGIVSFEPPQATILDIGSASCIAPNAGGIRPRPGAYGTVSYIAPEMEAEVYDESIDIWALGLVAHEIFLGSHPWQLSVNPWRPDKNCRYEKYLGIYAETLEHLRSGNPLENLIAGMLAWDPEDRLSASQALQHPCFISIRESTPTKEVKLEVKERETSETDFEDKCLSEGYGGPSDIQSVVYG